MPRVQDKNRKRAREFVGMRAREREAIANLQPANRLCVIKSSTQHGNYVRLG